MRLAQLLAAATIAAATHASHAVPRAAVAAPRADPAITAGVGRCTSDGVCTVTDDGGGTRAATPLRPFP